MEEVMSVLAKIQTELNDQKIAIRESGENVTKRVTENVHRILDEKLKILEEKYENIEHRLENQETRLYYMEKQARERNLIFFGIPENQNSYIDLENELTGFIHHHFNITIESIDIQSVKRLGKKTDKPRPIVVTFTTLRKKIEILRKKKKLDGTEYYIKEDYPKHIIEKRKELQDQVRVEREKGNKAFIKYDRLIVLKDNKKDPQVDEKNKNKRLLSTSPPATTLVKNSQAFKKNKISPLKTSSQDSRNTHKQKTHSDSTIKPSILNFLTNKNTSQSPSGEHVPI